MALDLETLSQEIKNVSSENKKNSSHLESSFREESNRNNEAIYSISKDLAKHFEAEQSKYDEWGDEIKQNNDEVENVARKIEDTNSIGQNSVHIQTQILAAIGETNATLEKILTDFPVWIKESGRSPSVGEQSTTGLISTILGTLGLSSLKPSNTPEHLGASQLAAADIASSSSSAVEIAEGAAAGAAAQSAAKSSRKSSKSKVAIEEKKPGIFGKLGKFGKVAGIAGLGYSALEAEADGSEAETKENSLRYFGVDNEYARKEAGAAHSISSLASSLSFGLSEKIGITPDNLASIDKKGTDILSKVLGFDNPLSAEKNNSAFNLPDMISKMFVSGLNPSGAFAQAIMTTPPSPTTPNQTPIIPPTTGINSTIPQSIGPAAAALNKDISGLPQTQNILPTYQPTNTDMGINGRMYSGGYRGPDGIIRNTPEMYNPDVKQLQVQTNQGIRNVNAVHGGGIAGLPGGSHLEALSKLFPNTETPFSGPTGNPGQGGAPGSYEGGHSRSGGGYRGGGGHDDPSSDHGGKSVAKGNLAKNQQEAYTTLRQEGMSESAARIMVANMSGESLRNPSDHHWDVKHMAQGIVQWDPFRSERIRKHFGKEPKDMSVAEQTRAAKWEMETYYKQAWGELNNDKLSDRERLYGVVAHYENPLEKQKATNERMQHLRGLNLKEDGEKESHSNQEKDDPKNLKGMPPETPSEITNRLKKLKAEGKVTNDECVMLARSAVGDNRTVREWRRGESAQDGHLVPGTPVSTFMTSQGGQSERYAGGGVGDYSGNHHAAVFENYIKDKSGNITGIHVAEQYKNSHGVREQNYMFGHGRGIHDGSNYHAIKDSHGDYLGGDRNPMSRIQRQPPKETPAEKPVAKPQTPVKTPGDNMHVAGGSYGDSGKRGIHSDKSKIASVSPSWGDTVRHITGSYGVA